jgi:Uma2 family endonuclease
MSTITTATAQQLFEMPDDGKRYELIAGELRMMSPSGWKHGEIVGKLHTILGSHVVKNRLGTVFGAETGFLIARDPDTVRAPDIAFIANENLPLEAPSEAYWPGAPDLAVEVLSPNDRTGEVDEKIHAWLSAGARLVWVVDPQLRTVTSYRSTTDVTTHTAAEQLDGGEIVRGFRCAVAEIFGAADPAS